MQFKTTYRNRQVLVDFGLNAEPMESLEDIHIIYLHSGDDIDYDGVTDAEYTALHIEVIAEYHSMQMDWAAERFEALNWD